MDSPPKIPKTIDVSMMAQGENHKTLDVTMMAQGEVNPLAVQNTATAGISVHTSRVGHQLSQLGGQLTMDRPESRFKRPLSGCHNMTGNFLPTTPENKMTKSYSTGRRGLLTVFAPKRQSTNQAPVWKQVMQLFSQM